MNWFQRNFKTIIYFAFLVPILTVAFVSISHVTTWYGITNPLSWAIYLSVGVEIAALASLSAISAQMGNKVYFPFGIVTLIQFLGNIFFAYQYIDVNSSSFQSWVEMVDPIVSYIGVESGNLISHKRFLALFAGGMLPLISLSFLHMLVKFEEQDKLKQSKSSEEPSSKKDIIVENIDEISKKAGEMEREFEESKFTPTAEDLMRLQKELEKLIILKESKDVDKSEQDTNILEEELKKPQINRLVYSNRNGGNTTTEGF